MRSAARAFDVRMIHVPSRRQILTGVIATVAAACASSRRRPAEELPKSALAAIEAHVGGRLGVFAIDTATGRQLAHRADERFPMCSTFKWVLAAAILARADRSHLSLEERIAYGPADLLEHAPVTREQLARGSMTVGALAHAAVTASDNTAANLLLAKVGGPAGVTSFVRSVGDTVTRLDRDEPGLNENAPGDPRDTTSPRAMATLMRRVLVGDVLTPASVERLLTWLRGCNTGNDRLRAGIPSSWTVGHKTGTGRRAVNDVAIAWPPGRAPVLVAAYASDSDADLASCAAAHADVGRLVARAL